MISPKLYSLDVKCVSFKCILPGSGTEQFLITSSWGWSVFHWIPGPISQSEQDAKRSQKKAGTKNLKKEKIGGCTGVLSDTECT